MIFKIHLNCFLFSCSVEISSKVFYMVFFFSLYDTTVLANLNPYLYTHPIYGKNIVLHAAHYSFLVYSPYLENTYIGYRKKCCTQRNHKLQIQTAWRIEEQYELCTTHTPNHPRLFFLHICFLGFLNPARQHISVISLRLYLFFSLPVSDLCTYQWLIAVMFLCSVMILAL